MVKTHKLKIEERYFNAIASGDKTFEIRLNDRFFSEGHELIFRCDNKYGYVGTIKAEVGYITDFEQKPGFCVFSLKNISFIYSYQKEWKTVKYA